MKKILAIDSSCELVLEADIHILSKVLDSKCQTCRSNMQNINSVTL